MVKLVYSVDKIKDGEDGVTDGETAGEVVPDWIIAGVENDETTDEVFPDCIITGVEDGETTDEVFPDCIIAGVEYDETTGEDGETTGEVVPDRIVAGVEDGETTDEVFPDCIIVGVEDGETAGEDAETAGEDGETAGEEDVPDSIGEGAEGVTGGETLGAVERGVLTGWEGTATGVLLVAGRLDAGGVEQLDDGAALQLKSIATMPIVTFGPDGELGWMETSW